MILVADFTLAVAPAGRHIGRRSLSRDLARVALTLAAALSAIELGWILWRLDGHFSFSLDDPYIHLALADEIAQGHYGLNAGEPAAPSSSILYPVLLAGLRWLGLGQFAALALCFAATLWSSVVTARLLGRSLPAAALPGPVGAVLTLSLILSLNLIGLEFTGLEHSLHVAVTLACLLGAIAFLQTGRVAPWWWLCGLAEPLIRYEGASLWLGIACLLLVRRRWLPGLALLIGGALLLGLFSLFLVRLGLAPLPSSVLIKSYVAGVGAGGVPASLIDGLQAMLVENMASFGMLRLGLLCLVLALQVFGGPRCRPACPPGGRALMALALFVGLAHLLLGRFGWFSRYEIYVVAFDLMTLVYANGALLGPRLEAATPVRVLIAALCPMAFLAAYPQTTAATPHAAQDIYDQQYQMHRFLDVYRKPVGVNDIGWVSYGHPAYVLDFWGLGSEEARKLRLADASGRWMDDLARRRGVGLAMIYADWFDSIPQTWQVVARLSSANPRTTGSPVVTFYATDPKARPDIEVALQAFAPTLPPGVSLTLAPTH